MEVREANSDDISLIFSFIQKKSAVLRRKSDARGGGFRTE